METDQSKLKRVILEYEDGHVTYLEGQDAQIWSDSLGSSVMNDWVHGGRLPKFNWIRTTIGELNKLFS